MTATPLLRLYQLLWEEIKDKNLQYIQFELNRLRDKCIISPDERTEIGHDVLIHFKDDDALDRKAFVLRRIEELKTENQ